MRVAVVSYHFSRHPRAWRVVWSLRRRGYRVVVWEALRLRGGFYRVIEYLVNMLRVLLVDADVVWLENIPDVVYVFAALRYRGRYVLSRRSPWAHEFIAEYPGLSRLVPLLQAFERHLVKHSCAVAVVSTPMRYEFDYEEWGKRVFVVPNYPERVFRCGGTRRLREELGVGDARVFLFVGKLSLVEGVDILAKTAAALKGTGAELWIVGDGPLSGLVRRLAERYEHVRWFGWVPRHRVPEFIASADYGLVPRRRRRASVFYTHEGVIKIGEYLRCGLPVIASGVAPSPYYLVVDDAVFPRVVREVALGRREVPRPLRIPSWEEVSEKLVIELVEMCSRVSR